MASNMSINSIDSDVFYVQQSSNDPCLPRSNTPIVLNSTDMSDMSGNDTRKMISISSIASPAPQFVTIDSDSNEPTVPFGTGRQLPTFPPILNDLKLPPNPLIVLATMAVAKPTPEGHDENYSPQSLEPSEQSQISMPP